MAGAIVPRPFFFMGADMKTLTLKDQEMFLQLFHSQCMGIVKKKNPDYAPDGIPLLDLLATAVEANISIPQALWPLFRKHVSSIRKHFFLGQQLASEGISGRLMDAANYCGFMAFYESYGNELHAVWAAYWKEQPCECEEKFPNGVPEDLCQRCETLCWLRKNTFPTDSKTDSSRSTRRARA